LSDDFSVGLPTAKNRSGGNDQSLYAARPGVSSALKRKIMNTIIYIVGLVVIIGIVLSYFGLR